MRDWSDDELLAMARDLADTQVPDGANETIMELFTWRSVDAELAALTTDSALDVPAGVRGSRQARTLTFAAHDLQIVVELTELGGRWQLLGLLAPGHAAEVAIRQGDAIVGTVHSDALGRFAINNLDPTEPLSLRCSWSGGSVITEWVLV